MSDDEKPQKNFQIGQIVYVLSDKAEAIVPAIVVEELVHKKLDGNSISWKVAVGPPEKKKIVASDELSGEVYTSLEEIQDVMVKRLTAFVDGLIGGARKRTEKWYGKVTKPTPKGNKNTGGKIDPADLLDTIDGRENGEAFRKAPGQNVGMGATATQQQQNQLGLHDNIRIQAPPNAGPLMPSQIDPNDPRSALRANLLRMAAPTPEELAMENQQQGEAEEYVMTDDGRRIPVKYNINE